MKKKICTDTRRFHHRKSHVAHFFTDGLRASLPACLLGQILTGLQLPTSSHGFCCFVDYTTSGRVRSKSRRNFSHHLHYMCWMHNWFTEFTCCSELKSSYVCTCYMSPDWNFTEYWQSWILLDTKYWNMNAECRWSWLKKNRILKFTSGAAASSSAWLRDRWCTRWCLRPAESSSSWSSAESGWNRGGLSLQRESMGAASHRCAISVKTTLWFLFSIQGYNLSNDIMQHKKFRGPPAMVDYAILLWGNFCRKYRYFWV